MNGLWKRTLWLVLLLVACLHRGARGTGLTDGPLQLDAVQGEMVHADGPAPGSPGSLRGALRFLELRGGGRWAPCTVHTALRLRLLFAAASSAKAKFVLAADSFL